MERRDAKIVKKFLGNYKTELQENFDPKKLKIDTRYQRVAVQDTVNGLAKDWNPCFAGVLYVSKRKNGSFYVIDGQHRMLAAKSLGLTVDVKIIHIDDDDPSVVEGLLFLIMNKCRKGMSANAIIMAEYKIGYEDARTIVVSAMEYDFNFKEKCRAHERSFDRLECVNQIKWAHQKEVMIHVFEYLQAIGDRRHINKEAMNFQSTAKMIILFGSICKELELTVDEAREIGQRISNKQMLDIKKCIGSRNAGDAWLKTTGRDEIMEKYPDLFSKQENLLPIFN